MKNFLVLLSLVAVTLAQSDEDLLDWSRDIWTSDANRYSDNDCQYNPFSSGNLFTYVNEAGFDGPTYSAFIDLLDNYITEIGTPEPECPECRTEEQVFLDRIMETSPMQKCHQYLVDAGEAPTDVEEFKENLYTYWFEPYSRSGGPLDSSGFEHVFVGEVRDGDEVTGFHSWVQAYLEEKDGNFVYESYIEECPEDVLTYSFNWWVEGTNYYKPIGGHWMRSSPEVEMAIYTLCYNTRRNQNCDVDVGGDMIIVNYDYQGTDQVGTAYPMCP